MDELQLAAQTSRPVGALWATAGAILVPVAAVVLVAVVAATIARGAWGFVRFRLHGLD